MSRIENGPGQTADGAKEEREGVIICPCLAWLGGGLATHAARNAVGRRKIPLHSPVALSLSLSLYAITILHCARQRTGEGSFCASGTGHHRCVVKRSRDDGRWEMRQPLSLRNAALLLREGRRGEERCPRGPIGHGGGELPLLVYITAERARQRRGRRSSRYARGVRALLLPARRRGAW